MASVKKFSDGAAVNLIRHIERTLEHPSNTDIDPDRLDEDYMMSPLRDMSSYSYFKKRKEELYCYDRKDLKSLAGWIITAPADLPEEQEELFFLESYAFLNSLYDERNCITAAVHKDESGKAHLHYLFIPVSQNQKYKERPEGENDQRKDSEKKKEKICASEVITREHLSNFHYALDKHLKDHGIQATVMNGITRRQGGNRTVAEMKRERDEKERSRWDFLDSGRRRKR